MPEAPDPDSLPDSHAPRSFFWGDGPRPSATVALLATSEQLCRFR